ncbi:MAG: hypothetical protein V1910_01745 [bacterium]
MDLITTQAVSRVKKIVEEEGGEIEGGGEIFKRACSMTDSIFEYESGTMEEYFVLLFCQKSPKHNAPIITMPIKIFNKEYKKDWRSIWEEENDK